MKGKIKKGLAVVLASTMFLPFATGCQSACTGCEGVYGTFEFYQDVNIVLNQNNKSIMHKGDISYIEDKAMLLNLDCGQEIITNQFLIHTENSTNNPDYEKCEHCFGE